jgi:hypothetical protein
MLRSVHDLGLRHSREYIKQSSVRQRTERSFGVAL